MVVQTFQEVEALGDGQVPQHHGTEAAAVAPTNTTFHKFGATKNNKDAMNEENATTNKTRTATASSPLLPPHTFFQ